MLKCLDVSVRQTTNSIQSSESSIFTRAEISLNPFLYGFRRMMRLIGLKRKQESGPIIFYTCGITTNAAPHIGHMRVYTDNARIVRLCEMSAIRSGDNIQIINVINFTDIDDKILAKISNRSEYDELVSKVKKEFKVEYDRLIKPYKSAPLFLSCSDFIKEIVTDISDLDRKGLVSLRESEDGYGLHLRAKSKEESFCLWKNKTGHDPIDWESEGFKGRPGWHIECSSMISWTLSKFGRTNLNLHMGGVDLAEIHHHNEETLLNLTYRHSVSKFLRTGLVTLGKAVKMSKSLGNTRSVDSVATDPSLIQYLYLTSPITQPVFLNDTTLNESNSGLRTILNFVIRRKQYYVRLDKFIERCNRKKLYFLSLYYQVLKIIFYHDHETTTLYSIVDRVLSVLFLDDLDLVSHKLKIICNIVVISGVYYWLWQSMSLANPIISIFIYTTLINLIAVPSIIYKINSVLDPVLGFCARIGSFISEKIITVTEKFVTLLIKPDHIQNIKKRLKVVTDQINYNFRYFPVYLSFLFLKLKLFISSYSFILFSLNIPNNIFLSFSVLSLSFRPNKLVDFLISAKTIIAESSRNEMIRNYHILSDQIFDINSQIDENIIKNISPKKYFGLIVDAIKDSNQLQNSGLVIFCWFHEFKLYNLILKSNLELQFLSEKKLKISYLFYHIKLLYDAIRLRQHYIESDLIRKYVMDNFGITFVKVGMHSYYEYLSFLSNDKIDLA